MLLRLRHRSIAAGLHGLWAGVLLTGTSLAAGPQPTVSSDVPDGWQATVEREEHLPVHDLPATGFTSVSESDCPPTVVGPRYAWRIVPSADLIGMPMHHRNYAGDCYGENWRVKQYDPSTAWGRARLRWHEHSLGMERCWGAMFGKLPRGYIHDTSGHPMRGFFVPQPGDPTIEYVPGSDTLMPSRMVIDYPKRAYYPGSGRCPNCEEHWNEPHLRPTATAPR